jgi:hypothetical protein
MPLPIDKLVKYMYLCGESNLKKMAKVDFLPYNNRLLFINNRIENKMWDFAHFVNWYSEKYQTDEFLNFDTGLEDFCIEVYDNGYKMPYHIWVGNIKESDIADFVSEVEPVKYKRVRLKDIPFPFENEKNTDCYVLVSLYYSEMHIIFSVLENIDKTYYIGFHPQVHDWFNNL